MMQIIGFSKDFFELVRDIGEAKSKEVGEMLMQNNKKLTFSQEEERIIKNEAQKLKVAMSQPDKSVCTDSFFITFHFSINIHLSEKDERISYSCNILCYVRSRHSICICSCSHNDTRPQNIQQAHRY